MSNVPQPTFGDNGFVLPDGSAVLTGVKSDVNAAFGGYLNMADETPQGQLSVALSALQQFKDDLFLWYCNQVDPAYSSGRMQDGIARIYFIERNPATATTVTATISGLEGASIPAGSLALATDGNLYSSLSSVVIPSGGSIDVEFACTDTGPIACPAGSLNRIYRTVSGWDSVVNAADGTPGAAEEGREAFETRRSGSVSLNAVGILPSIKAAVLNVSGVVDCYVTENDTGTSATIGGVSLAAHSIYVAVSGGTDADVAYAIWRKKSGGCAYNGNTTITVEDTSPGYSPPYPSYSVTFQRPTATPILFAVDIANGADVPSDAATQIKEAIASAFNGGAADGVRERIGGTVYASRYYCPIAALGAWCRIKSIKIGTVTANADTVSVNIDQRPTISVDNIAVTAT